jgi:membrane-bound lytic murein transglycosylase D
MRSIPLVLLFAASLAIALPADAQSTPRRPPSDTVRFGTTRPAAGDSIAMAEYDEEDADSVDAVARADESDETDRDTVPPKPRTGPYTRAGGTGPFTVQASGQTAPRPPRGEVVWIEGRAGQRVASGPSARSDTASADRPARRDTAAANRPARRDTASASTTGRAGANATAGGRNGSTSANTTTGGRTGTNSGALARARTHTVAAGETFYGIARRYGVTPAQLRAVNPDVQMEQLEIGDVLRLPASARDSRAGSAGQQQTAPRAGAQAQRRTHTVVAGETLYGIARRYGVTVAAIREANEMETDQVRTGQRLVIPPAR